MDIALLIIGALFVLVGIIGSILPLLPGPPIAWVGLLLLDFSNYADFSTQMLVITAIATVIIAVLDYLLPIFTTKKFGGTKAAQRGATIGTIIGIFLGPLGIIIGPFVGALLGELTAHPKDTQTALKVALASFVGFLLSTGIKLIWCMVLAWWFIKAVIT